MRRLPWHATCIDAKLTVKARVMRLIDACPKSLLFYLSRLECNDVSPFSENWNRPKRRSRTLADRPGRRIARLCLRRLLRRLRCRVPAPGRRTGPGCTGLRRARRTAYGRGGRTWPLCRCCGPARPQARLPSRRLARCLTGCAASPRAGRARLSQVFRPWPADGGCPGAQRTAHGKKKTCAVMRGRSFIRIAGAAGRN